MHFYNRNEFVIEKWNLKWHGHLIEMNNERKRKQVYEVPGEEGGEDREWKKFHIKLGLSYFFIFDDFVCEF